MKLAPVMAALLALWPQLGAAAGYHPPRTAAGQPDLQGTWTNASLTRVERSDAFETVIISEAKARAFESGQHGKPPIADDVGQADTEWWEMAGTLARIDGQPRTAWIVDPPDGRLPYTAEGQRTKGPPRASFDGPEARPAMERCLTAIGTPAGPPMLNAAYNSNYQIVQTRDAVAIVVEMNHDARIIRLGGRHPPASVRSWMGDSIGHWDGDTLVVETTNFRPEESQRGNPAIGWLFISPDAKVTERFTRTAADVIRYAFTVEDPKIYAKPWRAEMVFGPAKGPMFEFACHEGNYSMRGVLGGARQAEAAARDAAAKAAPPRTGP